MAKISKETMQQRLIDLYAENDAVRDGVFQGIRAEMLRLNAEHNIPGSEADHEFWGTTPEKYQRHPYPVFQRLMGMFYAMKSYDYVRESYKQNFKQKETA